MTPAEAIEVLQKRLVGEWVAVSGENVHVMPNFPTRRKNMTSNQSIVGRRPI